MSLHEQLRELLSTPSASHKRLVAYVCRQLGAGRSLNDVLDDPFLTNRLSSLEIRALLEEPEVIDAAADDVLTRMQAHFDEILRGA